MNEQRDRTVSATSAWRYALPVVLFLFILSLTIYYETAWSAVDIWIRPDASYLILDEDEFDEMGPTQQEREIVGEAVAEILLMLKERKGPFGELGTA